MIPVKLYNSKLSELDSVLRQMGQDPQSISEWLIKSAQSNTFEMAALKQKGAQSVALVKSMSTTDRESILGLKLTDNVMARQAMKMLSADEAALYEEIRDVERIQRKLSRLHGKVAVRLDAARQAIGSLSEQARAGGQGAPEAQKSADELERQVLPVLMRLRDELYSAIHYCNGEILLRQEKVARVNRKQLSIPKYNRRARRKRLKRAAAKEGKKIEDTHGDDGGGGGDGD